MSVRAALEKKNNQLNGTLATDAQLDGLRKKLPKSLLPMWYLSLLKDFRLSGTTFSLDDELDHSELGVDLKWLDPDQTVDEAQNVYPGKLVIGLCYLPIGSCLAGSGDPYFLNLDANSEDPALVRIPHDFIADDAYPEEEIELVCHSLSIFFEQSEIE